MTITAAPVVVVVVVKHWFVAFNIEGDDNLGDNDVDSITLLLFNKVN
ncbi:unnamed protein product [Schistosoma curassoni]|uniref:Dockerin domain-containing protein n=1 Tax=Schistosoma curassoni TaxID=6186 RepID=A0A183KV20_9TREM|nr:unnamed protein product [Schistosoma curassoni]